MFMEVQSRGTRDSGHALNQGRFKLDIRKKNLHKNN